MINVCIQITAKLAFSKLAALVRGFFQSNVILPHLCYPTVYILDSGGTELSQGILGSKEFFDVPNCLLLLTSSLELSLRETNLHF